MIGECAQGLSGINVPEYASGVSRRGDEVFLVDESTTAEISVVSHKLL